MDCLPDHRVYLLDVPAVVGGSGHPVGCAAGPHAVYAELGVVDLVAQHPLHLGAAVLADEDHGEPPARRQVEGLLDASLVAGSLAEVADSHVAVAAELVGEGVACAHGDAAADDAVGAQRPDGFVEDVVWAALAPVGAGGLGHYLGHHPSEVAALGHQVAQGPVGATYLILSL